MEKRMRRNLEEREAAAEEVVMDLEDAEKLIIEWGNEWMTRPVLLGGRMVEINAAREVRGTMTFSVRVVVEPRPWPIPGWLDGIGDGPHPTPGLNDAEKIAEMKERLGIQPDDPTGYQQAPARYTAQGRETIDRIRDHLGDEGFKAFCLGNAIKYEDRAGLKGDPEGDERKAVWYRRMFAHVQGDGPDPRSERDGFRAYERESAGGGLTAVFMDELKNHTTYELATIQDATLCGLVDSSPVVILVDVSPTKPGAQLRGKVTKARYLRNRAGSIDDPVSEPLLKVCWVWLALREEVAE